MRKLCLLLAAALIVAAVPAQTRSQLKKELKTKEASAKDADSLVEIAKWAKEKGLLTDHKRILTKALKKDKNHEAANHLAGNVMHDGKWMPKSKADMLRAKALEAEFKSKGLKKVDGVWVTEEEMDDAKQGRFSHDGEPVSRADKIALMAGKVRHPFTGEFIPKEDLDKADAGLFPLADGRWVSQKEADEYHSVASRPWVIRSHYATLITTEPSAKFDELKNTVDGAIDICKPLFGGKTPHPAFRPTILACPTTAEFKRYGEEVGDEKSVYGAFIAAQSPNLENLQLSRRPVICNLGEKAGWGIYYLRHATGLAYAASMAEQVEAEVPYWFLAGVASLAERHMSPHDASFFGQQHLTKGGVSDLKTWFEEFEISPNVSNPKVAYNIYQAGLVLTFCMRGGDAASTDAMQAVTAAFGKDRKAVDKAMRNLQRTIVGKEEPLKAYFQKVIQDGKR